MSGQTLVRVPRNRGKVGVGRWPFTPTISLGPFVNGSPWWMPANQANWKLASGDLTESTDDSSYMSSHSWTLEATSSASSVVLEATPTSKIEKERRRNSLRTSGSFAGLPMLYPTPLSSWARRATRSTRTRQSAQLSLRNSDLSSRRKVVWTRLEVGRRRVCPSSTTLTKNERDIIEKALAAAARTN
jgi:hypothetical protein